MFRSQSTQNLKAQPPQQQTIGSVRSRKPAPLSDLNTLPDPRLSSPIQPGSRTPSASEDYSGSYPDLSNEVAALSTKLINAINHQTNLDDNLQATRHDLVVARNRIQELEAKVNQHEEQVSKGVLVPRTETDAAMARVRSSLAEERQLRSTAEKQKKGVEQEIENLTASLFEEANTMVSQARRENEQLRGQLKDSETLRTVLQEQLQDLKGVLEKFQDEKDEFTLASSTPITPTAHSFDGASRPFDANERPPRTPQYQPVSADQPLKFSQLLRPVLRDDLPAYEDFLNMIRSARPTQSASRTTSNTITGAFSNASQTSITTSGQVPPVTPTAAQPPTFGSQVASPSLSSLPGSFNPSSPSLNLDTNPSLEKSKLYKRLLSEDIEPTLRLDAAPSLSFFARRSVLSSLVAGSLVIEPWSPDSRYYRAGDPCGLCGEMRKDELHRRRHRFRTSESEDAQRHPLCGYCLERVRATCELVGWLRLARGGMVKCEAGDEVRGAWEECTRLRERMFWARIGGGVVPAGASMSGGTGIPRISVEQSRREQREESPEADAGALEPLDVTHGPRMSVEDDRVYEKEKGKLPLREGEGQDLSRTPTSEQVKVPGGFD